MAKYLVLGMGSPSDMEAFKKSYERLGGLTPNQYLAGTDIRFLKEPLVFSCHRTSDRPKIYAKMLEDLAQDGNKVVAALGGGLSLALPGVLSAETSTLVVLGIPFYSPTTQGGTFDAPTAVYNLPPGTVVGGVPMHSDDNPSIDKAVLLAEKILNLEFPSAAVVGDPDLKQTKAVNKALAAYSRFMGATQKDSEEVADHNLAIHLSTGNPEMLALDGNIPLVLQCRAPHKYPHIASAKIRRRMQSLDFIDTMETVEATVKSLYFARAENAAAFFGRIYALSSPAMHSSLIEKKEDEQKEEGDKGQPGPILEKYGPIRTINKDSFTGGK